MNLKTIRIILQKEIIDIIRDKRTVMAMIVVPLLLYPLLFIIVTQVMVTQVSKLEEEKATVSVLGIQNAPEFRNILNDREEIEVIQEPEYRKALKEGEIQAAIIVPDTFQYAIQHEKQGELEIIVDLANDKSVAARDKLQKILDEYEKKVLAERVEKRELHPEFAQPIRVSVTNIASAKKMGGFIFGRVIPLILITMMFTGALYPAIDLTAGEKERGTMQTLLVSPANRRDIVIGKFFTVFIASMITASINVMSMSLTFAYGMNLFGKADAFDKLTFSLSPLLFLMILLIAVPLGFIFSSLAMAVATMARSFKEAQNYMTPLMIACTQPALVAIFPGIELNTTLAFIPIVNTALLLKEFLLGDFIITHIVLVFFSSLCFAWLAIHFATSIFNKEEVLLTQSEEIEFNWKKILKPDTKPKPFPNITNVITIFVVGILLLFYVAAPLQQWDIQIGMLITQVVLVLGLVLVADRLLNVNMKTSLYLHKTSFLSWLLMIPIAPAMMIIVSELSVIQNMFFPLPESYIKAFEEMFSVEKFSLIASLFYFALLPGICEESLFRGFVLGGLNNSTGKWKAILLSGVMFGIFHLDPYRLLSTTILGILFGYITVTTGSIFPAMLAHFLNNSMAIILSNYGERLRAIKWLTQGTHVPIHLLVAAVAIVGLSLLLIRRQSQRKNKE